MTEEALKSLQEMGFTLEEAQKALEATGGNLEAAVDFLDNYEPERYKLVFLVRTDLGMTPGKIAAQVGHASIGAYKQSTVPILDKWEDSGQAKIVLQVDSLDQLRTLEQCAKAIGIQTYSVEDAGRTQVEPGSVTVCAIGPDSETKINQVTGTLRLFR